MKTLFSLNYTQVMLIQFSFFASYLVVSLPSGYVVGKIGYKQGCVVGTVVTGLGCLMFWPAAQLVSYPFFLIALFVLASGTTILQVAANPYVTILGPVETASSRLNLTQGFNSLGTTLAPLFGALFILSVPLFGTESSGQSIVPLVLPLDISDKIEQFFASYNRSVRVNAVQCPYVCLGGVLLVLAFIVKLLALPDVKSEPEHQRQKPGSGKDLKSPWSYPHLVLGTIGIFVYVGAEVSIGSFLVNFLTQPNIVGLTQVEAGKFTAFYWGGAMIGRFIGFGVLRYIKPNKLLCANAFVAIILVVISIIFSGNISMWSILLVGLFNSIMFPTIFALAIKGLGRHTSQASGILVMAIVGGAITPLLQGVLADTIGIHHSFILPVLCYLYIAFYGLKGYKIRSKN
jgi:FHS family L-fucose permease-like MFS transporter